MAVTSRLGNIAGKDSQRSWLRAAAEFAGFRWRLHPSSAPRPFNLLRSFALLSLLSIGLITIISASTLTHFVTNHILRRDAVVSMEFIQSIAQDEHPQLDFRRRDLTNDDEGLGELFKHIGHMPDVVRANVFAPDGTIVWSTDQKLVGQQFASNDDLIEALEGKLIYELKNLSEHRKSEYVYFRPGVTEFIENYLPVINPATNYVIGVVEIYKVPRILLETLRQTRSAVWAAAGIGGIFLYVMLFGIVRRANMVIRSQQDKLIESETVAAMGEMAAAVAHATRNSLASIRTSAELAIDADDAETNRESAQNVIMEADRLEEWLRQLLLFSSPEGNGFKPVPIMEVVRSSLNGFSRVLEQQGVKLDFTTDDSMPLIKGDRNLLEQAFNSLISNALEAMPRGGTLKIAARSVRNDRYVEIEIRDTGCGIPADRMGKIFKPFYTSKSKGLGLGLSLVRRIVERHNGDMSLSSKENHGTALTLRFPVVPK